MPLKVAAARHGASPSARAKRATASLWYPHSPAWGPLLQHGVLLGLNTRSGVFDRWRQGGWWLVVVVVDLVGDSLSP